MKLFRIPSSFFIGLFACAVVFALPGCSATSTALQDLGDSVITTTGYTPALDATEPQKPGEDTNVLPNPEQEYFIGRAVAANILQKYKLFDDPILTDYLNQIMLALTASSELPNTFGGYHLAVLDTDEINALATPGGFIFLSRGMLKKIKDEDTLAAVIAHEISHVASRDGMRSITRDTLLKVLSELQLPASAISCNEVFLQCAVVFSAVVDGIVDNLINKGYSRETEYGADLGSIKNLRKAGFNPAAIIGILFVLKETKSSTKGWFATHPDPEDRIEKVNQMLGTVDDDAFFKAGIKERTRRFANAMELL